MAGTEGKRGRGEVKDGKEAGVRAGDRVEERGERRKGREDG